MAAPTAPRKNFITRDHRYVYLGGSFIALLGLGMFYSAPSPYSFIPAQSACSARRSRRSAGSSSA